MWPGAVFCLRSVTVTAEGDPSGAARVCAPWPGASGEGGGRGSPGREARPDEVSLAQGPRPRGHAPPSPEARRPTPPLPTWAPPDRTGGRLGSPRVLGAAWREAVVQAPAHPPCTSPFNLPARRHAPPTAALGPAPPRWSPAPGRAPPPRPRAQDRSQLPAARVSPRAGGFLFPGPVAERCLCGGEGGGGRGRCGGRRGRGAVRRSRSPLRSPPPRAIRRAATRTRAASGPRDSPAPGWPPPPPAPGSRTSTSSSRSLESKRGAGEAGGCSPWGRVGPGALPPYAPALPPAPEPAVPAVAEPLVVDGSR